MLGKLNHIAIAVPDIEKAAQIYRHILGAHVSEPVEQPEHGVKVVFITLPNSKIELLEPIGADSPIAKFLQKNPDGGIHHICCEVDDVKKSAEKIRQNGKRILADGKIKIGAHGKPIIFLHPKDFNGTLIELENT